MWPLEGMLLLEGAELPAPMILNPSTAEEVSLIMRLAWRHRVCIILRSGGSNVVGASLPSMCCAILDLSRLSRIVSLDEESLVLHVEAGALVWQVEEWLNKHGYTLSYQPQSIHLASIGGSIAMLGSGAYAPGRGNIEDILLWLDVVLPDGTRIRLGSERSPRGQVGPGLAKLFAGSEGLFGIIVAAGLRVRPLPSHVAQRAYVMPGLAEAFQAAKRLTLWLQPQLLRVQDPDEASLVYGLGKTVMLVGIEGDDRELVEAQASYADRVAQGLGGEPEEGLYEVWWKHRFDYDRYLEMLGSAGLWFDTIDSAAHWAALERVVSNVKSRVSRVPGVVAVLSHAGHFYPTGGALYFTVAMERNVAVYWKVWREAVDAIRGSGGSITHQHGLGVLRLAWAWNELGDQYRLICRVKELLDPHRVLNPYGLAAGCRSCREG